MVLLMGLDGGMAQKGQSLFCTHQMPGFPIGAGGGVVHGLGPVATIIWVGMQEKWVHTHTKRKTQWGGMVKSWLVVSVVLSLGKVMPTICWQAQKGLLCLQFYIPLGKELPGERQYIPWG